MELVPIIYQILIIVAGLLILVLAVSFIISRIKKSNNEDDGHDLVGGRVTQLVQIEDKLKNNPHPAPLPVYNNRPSIVERSKQSSPNIKVIRRSSTIKKVSHSKNSTSRTTFYPKTLNVKTRGNLKPRYTILNDRQDEPITQTHNGYTQTDNGFTNPEPEKFANFR